MHHIKEQQRGAWGLVVLLCPPLSPLLLLPLQRYHLLHPEYVMHRIKEQQRGAWGLVVLLCHIDVEDVVKPLREVTRAAALNGCTLVCAWSPEVRRGGGGARGAHSELCACVGGGSRGPQH